MTIIVYVYMHGFIPQVKKHEFSGILVLLCHMTRNFMPGMNS